MKIHLVMKSSTKKHILHWHGTTTLCGILTDAKSYQANWQIAYSQDESKATCKKCKTQLASRIINLGRD